MQLANHIAQIWEISFDEMNLEMTLPYMGGSLHFLPFFFFRIRFRKTQPALAVRPLTPNPYTALIEFTSGYSGDWKPLTVCFIFHEICLQLCKR